MFIRQPSFAKGEWAPTLWSRSDLEGYLSALRTCKNWIVTKHGSLVNRPGTKYIGDVKDHTKKVRLIPFNFADGQNYVLEFGDLYVRFWKNGGQIMSGMVPYEVVTPYTEAQLPRLKFAQVGNVLTLVHPSHFPRELARSADASWALTKCDFGRPKFDTIYGAGSNALFLYWGGYSLPATFNLPGTSSTSAVVHQWAVTYDDGSGESYPVFSNAFEFSAALSPTNRFGISVYSPFKHRGASVNVYRGKDGIFGLIGTAREVLPGLFSLWDDGLAQDFSKQPPMGNVPFSDSVPAAWAANTLYQVGDRVTSGGNVYEAVLPGLSHPTTGPSGLSQWIYGGAPDRSRMAAGAVVAGDRCVSWGCTWACTVPGNSTNAVGSGGPSVGPSTAPPYTYTDGTAQWEPVVVSGIYPGPVYWKCLGPSAAVTNDYPAVVSIIDQRRVFGNVGTKAPGRLVGSMVGAYSRYDANSAVLVASDPFDFTLASMRYEEIKSLASARALLAFTGQSSPWSISGSGSNADDVITPSSVLARPHGHAGSSWLDPAFVEDVLLYVADKGNAVRDLVYNSGAANYESRDLTVLSSHLFDRNEIVSWAYAQAPFRVVWAARDDGALLGLTYMREHELAAWHRHSTQGTFEQVCSVQEGNEDAVYFVVNRTIGGGTKRYMERFASRLLPLLGESVDSRYGVFLDSSLSWDGAPATVFSGLDHLEGEAVTVLADGGEYGPYVVAGGSVDLSAVLPDGASVVNIGLAYESDGEMLDPVLPKIEIHYAKKNCTRVALEVVDTRGLAVGRDFNNMRIAMVKTDLDAYGVPTPLTGTQMIQIPGKFDLHGRVAFRQASPLPAMIVAIGREVDLGGD